MAPRSKRTATAGWLGHLEGLRRWVLLVWGHSGQVLRTLGDLGKHYTASDIGFALWRPGDLDGDGAPELFVTALQEILGGGVFGLRTIDGKPYAPLRHLASW